MSLTRAFKSGNSQAIRVPAKVAYDDTTAELSVERYGDILVIAPPRESLREMVAALRALPKPSEIERYEPIDTPDRLR